AVDAWSKLAERFTGTQYASAGLFRAGRAQFELGQSTAAVQTFARFMQTYPNSPKVKDAFLQSAHAFYNAGDAASAAPLYAGYMRKYQSTEDVALVTPYLAACYVKMGK